MTDQPPPGDESEREEHADEQTDDFVAHGEPEHIERSEVSNETLLAILDPSRRADGD